MGERPAGQLVNGLIVSEPRRGPNVTSSSASTTFRVRPMTTRSTVYRWTGRGRGPTASCGTAAMTAATQPSRGCSASPAMVDASTNAGSKIDVLVLAPSAACQSLTATAATILRRGTCNPLKERTHQADELSEDDTSGSLSEQIFSSDHDAARRSWTRWAHRRLDQAAFSLHASTSGKARARVR